MTTKNDSTNKQILTDLWSLILGGITIIIVAVSVRMLAKK